MPVISLTNNGSWFGICCPNRKRSAESRSIGEKLSMRSSTRIERDVNSGTYHLISPTGTPSTVFFAIGGWMARGNAFTTNFVSKFGNSKGKSPHRPPQPLTINRSRRHRVANNASTMRERRSRGANTTSRSTHSDYFWWSSFMLQTFKTTKVLISFCTVSKASTVDSKSSLPIVPMGNVVCRFGQRKLAA